MKILLNILTLFFLLTSCSKEEDAAVLPTAVPAAPEIPVNNKFLESIDRYENDISFAYGPDQKVTHIYFGTGTMYAIDYEGNRISRIILFSGTYDSYAYEFAYNDTGKLTGYFRYTTTDYSFVSFQALVYNAATNSYNDWLYMYDNGAIRRVVTADSDRTLVYDTLKRGALYNGDQNLVTYLMLINRNVVLWPQYIGRNPCTQVIYQQGAVSVANTYDQQDFISNSHIDATLNNLDATYNYTAL